MITDCRRKDQRVPYFTRASLQAVSGGAPIEAHTRDISLSGVGLSLPKAPAVGEVYQVAFRVRGRGGSEAIETLPGRVVHVRADEACVHVGIEFVLRISSAIAPALFEKLMEL